MRRCIFAFVALAAMLSGKPSRSLLAQSNDPGCENATLVSTGGEFPGNPQTYKPDVYIPAHHDGSLNELWRATEPLFQALKDENPTIVTSQ